MLSGQTLQLKGKEVHFEVELGIVIGMNGRHIKPENAMSHIAGYFVGVDFTNRALQTVCKDTGADWILAKGADQFGAISDYIHKSAVPDVGNVEVELTINGETRQKSNTSKLIFDVPTMIADISKYQELREGDIIYTGTPEGVG